MKSGKILFFLLQNFARAKVINEYTNRDPSLQEDLVYLFQHTVPTKRKGNKEI